MSTECNVCLEPYETEAVRVPKLLPCSHTLCLQCLLQVCDEDKDCVQCPECRAVHGVPNDDGDVASFPTNRSVDVTRIMGRA